MTNNSDRQREIEELIERLMAEKHNRTSVNVITNNSEEWDHDHAVMRDCAAPIILTELEYRPPGAIVPKDFMERHILRTFLASHAWRPSLELRLNGGILKWSNAVDWARVDLGNDGLLMRATDVPGSGYQLVTGAEHMLQKHLREQEVQALRAHHEQADGSPKKKRKRAEAEVEDCNAIYIMFDPKRPDRCKIGAGNGDCKARETEAKRWTNGEAKLVHVQHIGSGRALAAEPPHVKGWNWPAIESTRNGSNVNGRWPCRSLKPWGSRRVIQDWRASGAIVDETERRLAAKECGRRRHKIKEAGIAPRVQARAAGVLKEAPSGCEV